MKKEVKRLKIIRLILIIILIAQITFVAIVYRNALSIRSKTTRYRLGQYTQITHQK